MSALVILHSSTRKVKFVYIEEHGITPPKSHQTPRPSRKAQDQRVPILLEYWERYGKPV
jgi:hypothetical protein